MYDLNEMIITNKSENVTVVFVSNFLNRNYIERLGIKRIADKHCKEYKIASSLIYPQSQNLIDFIGFDRNWPLNLKNKDFICKSMFFLTDNPIQLEKTITLFSLESNLVQELMLSNWIKKDTTITLGGFIENINLLISENLMICFEMLPHTSLSITFVPKLTVVGDVDKIQ